MYSRDWSSDVCSSDLGVSVEGETSEVRVLRGGVRETRRDYKRDPFMATNFTNSDALQFLTYSPKPYPSNLSAMSFAMPQSRNTSPFSSGTSLPRYKFKVGGPPGRFHVTRGDSRFHTNSAVDNLSAYPTPVEASVALSFVLRVLRTTL